MFGLFFKKPVPQKSQPQKPRNMPYDVVMFDDIAVKLWENRDSTGRRFVGFSLHKQVTLDGEQRMVNSFDPMDVWSVLGAMLSVTDWFLADRSTKPEAARELTAFRRTFGELISAEVRRMNQH